MVGNEPLRAVSIRPLALIILTTDFRICQFFSVNVQHLSICSLLAWYVLVTLCVRALVHGEGLICKSLWCVPPAVHLQRECSSVQVPD